MRNIFLFLLFSYYLFLMETMYCILNLFMLTDDEGEEDDDGDEDDEDEDGEGKKTLITF